MARLFDNCESVFADALVECLKRPDSIRADFCVGYFNLRGWGLISDAADTLEGEEVYEQKVNKGKGGMVKRYCRLIVGMVNAPEEDIAVLYSFHGRPERMDTETARKSKARILAAFRRQLVCGVPCAQDEVTLHKLCEQLGNGRLAVRLYLRNRLHAKLYNVHRKGAPSTPLLAMLGSSNLTMSGLKGNSELDIELVGTDADPRLDKWFVERWDDQYCLDITDELIQVLQTSWASEEGFPPYYIYLKVIYWLCREAREGSSQYEIPDCFKDILFDFQKAAVKLVVQNLRKQNGAMLGDVVGLGKTFTGSAVAKMFEECVFTGGRTLILCPAKLCDMWRRTVTRFDLKADVVSISAGDFSEQAERHYRLVIIDESHNLRNGGKRFSLISDLIKKSLDCPVLLMTATPYNKDYSDLMHQLSLFLDENADLGIRPEACIKALGGSHEFSKRYPILPSSLEAFGKSNQPEDWADLMRLFLVRRTRTFIKKNYASYDEEKKRYYLSYPTGGRAYFPERITKAIKYQAGPADMLTRLYSKKTVDALAGLALPRYGLQNYKDEAKLKTAPAEVSTIFSKLSRAGARLIGFCKSSFFKRMDSSGIAFLISLYRHILRNEAYICAIDRGGDLFIRDMTDQADGFEEDEDTGDIRYVFPTRLEDYQKDANDYYERLKADNKTVWISSRYFTPKFRADLVGDTEQLLGILSECAEWFPSKDEKLRSLFELVSVSHPQEKILIFTQYTDTAEYLLKELKKLGVAQIEAVSGKTDDVGDAIMRFSPVSSGMETPPNPPIRVLIATDLLSEGQNLQDSHIIVNYDLPWAIIRLIQRAGRVDRIGQGADDVLCYSFFPKDQIEEIIQLRERLNERINTNAGIVGSDEVFFEGNKQNIRDLYNEKSGILDEDDTEEVDLTSKAYQIWQSAIQANPALAKIIPALPDVIYSAKTVEDPAQEGVITYARTPGDLDLLTWISPDKQRFSLSPLKLVDQLACPSNEAAATPWPEHHELVAESLRKMVSDIPANNAAVGGILGQKTGVRYRLFNLLDNFIRDSEKDAPLFVDGTIRAACNDVYKYPLLETARTSIGAMMRNHASDLEIADYVRELQSTGKLCNIPDENSPAGSDPSIICSMSLRARK